MTLHPVKFKTFAVGLSVVFFLSASGALVPHQVCAEVSEKVGQKLGRVVVEGVQRIDRSTVMSYLTIKPGDTMSAAKLNDSLKALYKTNFFTDVVLDPKGSTLYVRVQENPIINRVAFEGNAKVTSETLDKEIGISPRTVYTRSKVQEAQQKLLQIYRVSGRFAAKVEPKIIKQDQNRVDLVFEIDEGPVTQVQKISFIGNKRFSESALEAAIQTKESRWYRFFTSDDTYDPDRLTYDQEKLRQFYLNHGYADFKIISAVAELSPDQKDFFITFTINEGEKYQFGNILIESEIAALRPDELRASIDFVEGDVYSAKMVDKSLERLVEKAGEKGYAFVDPRPNVKKNKETKKVDITFTLGAGPKVFIQRIDIVGNTRTLDSVIRRELEIAEGDAFNAVRIRKSLQKVKDLNYFKKVDLTRAPGDREDRVILKLEVEEQSTGELNFSGGYGTTLGPLGEISIRERNVMGTGQEIAVRTRIARRYSMIDVDYMEPYFLGRPLRFGVNVYTKKESQQHESSFTERNTGFGTWIGYDLAEYWSQVLGYNLSVDRISHIPTDASVFIREQRRKSVTSAVYQTLSYDRRDSKLEPTSGYILSLSNEFAGVGGTTRYLKNTLTGVHYYPITEEIIWSNKARTGWLLGLGKTVRVTDRFSLGGESLRGFDYGGVGPRDKTGFKDALGGMKFYALTSEVTMPIGLPNEFGIKGSIFVDAGALWDPQKRHPNIYDDSSLRAAGGFGVTWKSPMGPLRVDFAWPIIKKPLDKTRVFLLGFSTKL